ncbi:hypothetical protein [Bacillus sp. NEAU-Y102]
MEGNKWTVMDKVQIVTMIVGVTAMLALAFSVYTDSRRVDWVRNNVKMKAFPVDTYEVVSYEPITRKEAISMSSVKGIDTYKVIVEDNTLVQYYKVTYRGEDGKEKELAQEMAVVFTNKNANRLEISKVSGGESVGVKDMKINPTLYISPRGN